MMHSFLSRALGALTLAVVLAAAPAHAQRQRNDLVRRADLPRATEETSLWGTYLAARSASAAKDLDTAAQFFSDALQRDPHNAELLARAFVLRIAAGQIDEAIPLAQQVMRVDAADRLGRLVLAVKAIKDKRFRTAVSNLKISDHGNISDITGGLIAAWASQGAGDTNDAFAILDRIKGTELYDIFRDYHAGLLAELAGRQPEAAKRLAAAYKADPNALRVMEAYARNLARNGDKAKATEVLNAFLARAPENPVAKALLADIAAGRPIAPIIRDAQRGAAEVLFGLGSALSRDGGDELAAIYLQLSLYLDDENGLTLISLADLYDQMKRPEKVVEAYRHVPDSSPMKRASEIQLALALDDLERTDEALARLDALLKKAPNDVDVLTAKGNILRARKRFEEAVTVYDQAIAQLSKAEPRNWTLFYFRGIAEERSKTWAKAEADFKKALELQPDQPLVLNYLGYSWVDQGLNLDEAMTMLKRAVDLRPTDGYIIDSVGWAYFRLGKFEEAQRWLERAIDNKPADPVINDHLGDAYWRVGRTLEARFQWAHARDLKPEPEDLVRIEKKIEDGLSETVTPPPMPAVDAGAGRRDGG